MKRDTLVAVAVAFVCTVLPLAGQFYGDRQAGWLMVDFKAYYCAASAAARHANPYFVSSTHACQAAKTPPYYRAPSNVTIPAPYPPYVLALLYPLTRLPFRIAVIVWWVIAALSAAISAYALARITRQPLLVAWATLALPLGLSSLSSGNVVPVCIAALLLAALCAQTGELQAMSFAVALAMIKPQLALPAAIAAWIRFPASRLTLVLLFALMAVGSLATSGLARNLEYITSVLPAHALSEVSRVNQYSLSTVVSALGVPDAQAVTLGNLSYAVMAIAGIIVGIRLARDYRDPAFALLVPPAFGLLGGSYVHTGDIVIAAPACLLLILRAHGHQRVLLVALLLLSVPWMFASSAASFLAPIFPVAFLAYRLGGRDRTLALGAALGSLVLIGSLFFMALEAHSLLLPNRDAHPPIDLRLAEASWRALVLGTQTNPLIFWLLRLPTWVGLIAFALSAGATAAHAPRYQQVHRTAG